MPDSQVQAVPPSVTVIVATRNRPELLRAALDTIVGQDYEGDVECLLVFDQTPPDESYAMTRGSRSIRVLPNTRSPGLAGARNTGILASGADFVAFCDDDDTWRPSKLRLQIEAVEQANAVGAVCGITIHYGDRAVTRVPATAELNLATMTRDRVAAVHSSSVLFRRAALLGGVGLVDEAIPGAYGEDYDLLLRAVKAGAVVSVEQALVDVLWHEGSYFAERWRTIVQALDYLVDKHPEFKTSPEGLARIEGQKAFAFASLGERRPAAKSAVTALRLNWRERRAYLALLIAGHLLSPRLVLHLAHTRGRGI